MSSMDYFESVHGKGLCDGFDQADDQPGLSTDTMHTLDFHGQYQIQSTLGISNDVS